MRFPLPVVALAAFSVCCASSAQTQPNRSRDDAWRAEIRRVLDIPPRLPAVSARTRRTFSPTPGVLADRITYATADGMLVPAVVFRPEPRLIPGHTKLPAFVVVCGHGSDKFGWYSFYTGMQLAKAGAVVLTYDPIGEGERNDKKQSRDSPSPHDVYPPAPEGVSEDAWHMTWGRHVAGLMQVDLYQAVSYLAAQPEVDKDRIGLLGYSMGSFVAALEAAWDTRVHGLVLSGAGVFDGPGEYYDSGKLPCQMPPYRALLALDVGGKPFPASARVSAAASPVSNAPDRGAILYALIAAHAPMLVQNGSADTVMDIPHHGPDWFESVRSRALAFTRNDPRATANMFTTVFYPGISHRTSWVNLDGVRWLNAHFHLPLWNSDAKIAEQGTTHVSTWINANNVSISKSYIREDREGGLDAVGSGFPGIPREELMVLPEAEWTTMRDQLTWNAWRDKMLPIASREVAEAPAAHPNASQP